MAMMAFCLQRVLVLQRSLPQAAACGLTALRASFSTGQPLHIMRRPKFLGPLPDFKCPASPYALFIQECCKTQPMDMKQFAANWKTLTEKEKQPYIVNYELKKNEYSKLYEEFLQTRVGSKKLQEAYLADLKEHKAKMREYMKQFRLKKMNLLKPRKVSGYALFVKESIKSSEDQSKENCQSMISTMAERWNAAGKMERARYNALADTLHEAEMKAYERRYKNAIKVGIVPIPKEPVAKLPKKPEAKKAARTKTKVAAKKASKTAAKQKTSKTATKTKSRKAAKKATKTREAANKAEKDAGEKDLFSSDSDEEVSEVAANEELFADADEEEVLFDGSTEYEGDEALDEEGIEGLEGEEAAIDEEVMEGKANEHTV